MSPTSPTDDDLIALFGRMSQVQAGLARRLGSDLEASCGVPLLWFDVLALLGHEEDEQLTMGVLAERVALTTGGVTRLVDRMEAAGTVERIASPTDRRVIHVALTDKGKVTLSEASDVHSANVRGVFESFSDRELAVLNRLLGRLGGAP